METPMLNLLVATHEFRLYIIFGSLNIAATEKYRNS